MKSPAKAAGFWPVLSLSSSLLAVVCAPVAAHAQSAQIESLKLLPTGSAVELEIQMTRAIAPRTQIVASPDRLVIDFPEATPGPKLRGLPVNRGEVVGVRVGLFESNPPTTRVVLDLKSPINYQVFPSAKSVMIKLGGPPAPAAAVSIPAPEVLPEPPKPKVTVSFANGLLSIFADKATLAQVLYEIHNRTGAEIAVPAGAEQEQVFASIGPAPPKDVLASLLNGSPYNFILVGSSSNPDVLERILLTQKGTSMVLDMPMPQTQAQMNGPNPGMPVSPGRMLTRNRGVVQQPPDSEPEENNVAPEDEPQPDETQPALGEQTPAAPQQQVPPPQN